MPQVRKLAPEEVQAFQNKGKGQRKLVEEEYDAILSDYEIGDYGEAILEPEDNRLTVRNRLKAAASRRQIGIDFRRTSGDMLRFKIVEQTNGSAALAEPPVLVSSSPPPVVPNVQSIKGRRSSCGLVES